MLTDGGVGPTTFTVIVPQPCVPATSRTQTVRGCEPRGVVVGTSIMLKVSVPPERAMPSTVCAAPPIVAVALSVARLNPAAEVIVASTL
jgi:hypothetical protein